MAEISLNKARTIIKGTFAKSRELGLKPIAAVVLDTGGHLKAFERQDGASPGRFQVAGGKAYGSIMLGIPSSAQMARAESQAYFIGAVNAAFDGRLIPVPGGILIRNSKGVLIGALGVSGDTSENDVLAGCAGIELAGYQAEA